MDRKWYCFDCRYLDLKVDKQGNITGEKYCPIWKLHRSDWQDICSSFESKKEVKQAKICGKRSADGKKEETSSL